MKTTTVCTNVCYKIFSYLCAAVNCSQWTKNVALLKLSIRLFFARNYVHFLEFHIHTYLLNSVDL